MSRSLNRFERGILQWILRKVVVNHQLCLMFHDLREVLVEVWWEDNHATRESIITEALNDYRSKPIGFIHSPRDL